MGVGQFEQGPDFSILVGLSGAHWRKEGAAKHLRNHLAKKEKINTSLVQLCQRPIFTADFGYLIRNNN